MSHSSIEEAISVLRNEHAALDQDIADWRIWWKQLNEMGDPHFGEMGDRLARFRAHLQDHFAREESGGCLSLEQKQPRGILNQAQHLKSEHPGLLQELDTLIQHLHACDLEHDCWGRARQDFESFLNRLNTHEAAEDDLLKRMA